MDMFTCYYCGVKNDHFPPHCASKKQYSGKSEEDPFIVNSALLLRGLGKLGSAAANMFYDYLETYAHGMPTTTPLLKDEEDGQHNKSGLRSEDDDHDDGITLEFLAACSTIHSITQASPSLMTAFTWIDKDATRDQLIVLARWGKESTTAGISSFIAYLSTHVYTGNNKSNIIVDNKNNENSDDDDDDQEEEVDVLQKLRDDLLMLDIEAVNGALVAIGEDPKVVWEDYMWVVWKLFPSDRRSRRRN